MTLLEFLKQNRGKYCYPAGIIIESTMKDDKKVEVKLAEVWQIPVRLLDMEMGR